MMREVGKQPKAKPPALLFDDLEIVQIFFTVKPW